MQSHSAHQQRSTFKFDHAFNIPQSILPGGHIFHITAYNQPLNSNNVGEHRQFILRFDGQRFSQFTKIYELGGPDMMNTYRNAIHKLNQSQQSQQYDTIAVTAGNNNSHGENGYNGNIGHETNSNNNNNTDYDVSETYSVVGDRPRYNPKTTRGRSSTADNGILASDVARANSNFNTNDNYYINNNIYSVDDNHVDRYWEKAPALPNNNNRGKNTRMSVRTAHHRISSSLSPTRQRFNNIHNNTYNNNNQDWFRSGKYDQRDVAMDSNMEQKYIAKAMVHSFRDLRGDNGVEDDDNNDDNMSIPTFARPPRVIKNSNNRNTHHTNAKHPHSPHLATVQETSSVKDLLGDNYATGHDSNDDGPYNLIRSTSSITIDTMLRDSHLDNDNISVLTDQYSHLDPKQMSRTQQNISFRLQTPPVYADSTAGDLIQPSTASFVGGGMNGNSAASHHFFSPTGHPYGMQQQQYHQHQQQQPQQLQQNVYPGFNNMNHNTTMRSNIPTMNTTSSNHNNNSNVMNFAGRHMNLGFVPAPPPTWDTINSTFAMPQQQQQQHQT